MSFTTVPIYVLQENSCTILSWWRLIFRRNMLTSVK